jgi:hypothetical protein
MLRQFLIGDMSLKYPKIGRVSMRVVARGFLILECLVGFFLLTMTLSLLALCQWAYVRSTYDVHKRQGAIELASATLEELIGTNQKMTSNTKKQGDYTITVTVDNAVDVPSLYHVSLSQSVFVLVTVRIEWLSLHERPEYVYFSSGKIVV